MSRSETLLFRLPLLLRQGGRSTATLTRVTDRPFLPRRLHHAWLRGPFLLLRAAAASESARLDLHRRRSLLRGRGGLALAAGSSKPPSAAETGGDGGWSLHLPGQILPGGGCAASRDDQAGPWEREAAGPVSRPRKSGHLRGADSLPRLRLPCSLVSFQGTASFRVVVWDCSSSTPDPARLCS